MDIKDKVAVVTGGAAGFGLRLVEQLTEGGAHVAALDIDESALGALAGRFPAVTTISCDITDPQAVESAVAEVAARAAHIDILINNAGIMKSAPLINLLAKDDRRHSVDLWRKVMDVNLNAVFYLTANVADHMLRGRIKGVVVNISSISARGNAGQSAYAASKAGVEALTKVWAKELGRFGIRCGAVAPGFSETKSTADALEKELLDRWVSQVPLRRLGTADEVCDAVLFIIRNDFFNGGVIALDGGLVV